MFLGLNKKFDCEIVVKFVIKLTTISLIVAKRDRRGRKDGSNSLSPLQKQDMRQQIRDIILKDKPQK